MLLPLTPPTSALSRVVDQLRAIGTLSRVEIAERTGLAPATITHAVRDLLTAGLVREVGVEQRPLGQPRRLLRLETDAWRAVGIQIDAAAARAVVTDFAGRVVASAALPGTGSRHPQRVVEDLADDVRLLLRSAGAPLDRVLGAGLVTHGPQDRLAGTLRIDRPTPAWRGFPLTDALSAALGLPVLLENDATAAAMGELRVGTPPAPDFALVYLGAGVGGAVIVDGAPYRGRSSNSVEIGHVSLTGGDAPCPCGKRGCVEAEAGPLAVVAAVTGSPELAAELGVSAEPSRALEDFERIARAARDGDERVAPILEASARRIGDAALVLADLFDVDAVVLAGPALATAGPVYRRAVARALEGSIVRDPERRPRAALSADATASAAVGAALHVLRSAPVPPPSREEGAG